MFKQKGFLLRNRVDSEHFELDTSWRPPKWNRRYGAHGQNPMAGIQYKKYRFYKSSCASCFCHTPALLLTSKRPEKQKRACKWCYFCNALKHNDENLPQWFGPNPVFFLFYFPMPWYKYHQPNTFGEISDLLEPIRSVSSCQISLP